LNKKKIKGDEERTETMREKTPWGSIHLEKKKTSLLVGGAGAPEKEKGGPIVEGKNFQ